MTKLKKTLWFIATEIEGDRAGGFRQSRWVQFFLAEGFDVKVINYSFVGTYSVYSFNCIEKFKEFREVKLSLNKSKSGVRQGTLVNLMRKFKHTFFLEFFNIGALRVYFFLRKQQLNHEHVVMSSSPPIVSALIAYLTKLKFKDILLINDLRDAWAQHPALGGNKRLKKKIESIVLSSADFNVTVSCWLKNEYESTYGVDNFYLAYNVSDYYSNVDCKLDLDKTLNIKVPNGYKVIAYTGSIPHGHFDLLSFVSAVRNRVNHSPFSYIFLFVGNCVELKKLVEGDTVLNSYFVFINHLPNKDIFALQNTVDILLFLGFNAEGNAGVVSTKIFEYIYLKKPILPVNVKFKSDVSSILRKYCGKTINIEKEIEIYDLLNRDFENELPVLMVQRDDFVGELVADYYNFIRSLGETRVS